MTEAGFMLSCASWISVGRGAPTSCTSTPTLLAGIPARLRACATGGGSSAAAPLMYVSADKSANVLKIRIIVIIISTRPDRVLTARRRPRDSGKGAPRSQAIVIHRFFSFDFLGDRMKIRPLHDRVIVKRIEEERKSAGGIVIPDTAAEKPDQGEIVAVGKGKKDDQGKLIPIDVKVGDRVLFGKYYGETVKVKGDELLVMREEDIMGVIES